MIPRGMLLAVALSSFLRAQQEVQPPSAPVVDQSQPPGTAPSAGKRDQQQPDNKQAHTDNDKDKEKGKGGDSQTLPPGEDPENRLLMPFLRHLASDQATFWTAPVHFRTRDLQWALPFAGITAGFIASDSWMSKQVPANHVARSKSISNYAVYSLIGLAGGSYALGYLTHNDHLGETGFLAGEAAVNSTAVDYIFKEITRRQRPYQSNGNGTFFQGGTSFPSEHSAVAWSAASVWAHEYPGTLSQLLAYGLASTVTITRVTGQQHFPSDAIVGSALGWYFGRQVYRAHHDTELGGAPWGGLLPDRTGERTRNPANMGSPYVPLDSWIYPAFERLVALGYIRGGYLGMRPWTRMECARLVEEAGDNLQAEQGNKAEQDVFETLASEFADETRRRDGASNLGAKLESVYTRVTGISGQPLRDGYHFGQTIADDYGRPYGEGFNNVTGVTAYAVAGPLSFSLQGEYQRAPAVPSDPPGVLQAIAAADATSPVANARADVNRFPLLDSTVAVTFRNTQFSFGKQSQWMGPGESGSLLFSNNAEPVLMFKIDSVSPYRVPLLSRILGPIRTEYFLGQLAGHQFEVNGSQLLGPGNIHPQPFLDGAKISFKPTSNLEIGMGFTAQFVGPGLPFTWRDFLRTFYVHNQTGPTTASNNPGKRISSADFTYRVPGLRDWLTFYADTLVVDEISPIGSSRATVNPGIYLPKFPKLPQLELRAEGIHEPLTSEFTPGFVYFGARRYRSGYTNDGNLMGSWIGRAGRGGQGWLTYWFSPRSSLQAGYRLQEVSKDFLGGGRSADYSARGTVMLSRQISLAAYAQYEQWRFPVLSASGQSNVTASVQLTFYPKSLRIRR